MDERFDKLVELLKPVVEDELYLDEDGFLKNYIDYREAGSIDQPEDFEKLAYYYGKHGGNMEGSADLWFYDQDWYYEIDDYYNDLVRNTCLSYLEKLTDEEASPFTADEIMEEFNDAIDEDRFGLFESIGYYGVDPNAIEYFPDYVTIDVFINPAVKLPYDSEDLTVEFMKNNCKVICDLLQSGGISIEEFIDAYKNDDLESLGKFGKSVAEDMEEGWTDVMMWLTACAKVPLEDYCKLASGQASTISINPGIQCFGLYNPYDGGGTPIEIELQSPFTVSANNVEYQIDTESTRKGSIGYTIRDVYGLVESAFVEDGITIQ